MLVACVKVGTAYGPEYVNRLAAMVARHTTRPYQFLCLTDSPKGLMCQSSPIRTDLPGWWAKLALFNPLRFTERAGTLQYGRYVKRVLYMDLDTVICGNIDALFDYVGSFAILRSFLPPSRYGSAIMSFEPWHVGHIWERFTPDVMMRLHGDQDWIAEQMPNADYWQDIAPGLIGSYKVDQLENGPRGFSVCCFHGEPKPHQVNGWVSHAWR